MSHQSVGKLLLWVLVGLAFAACSDGDGEGGGGGRSPLLNLGAGQIAADALSEKPSGDFVKARTRIDGRITKERKEYLRAYTLVGNGKGFDLAHDPELARARADVARALGTTLDPAKETDAASAQQGLDALLAELMARFPGAVSCATLPGQKSDDCAIALIVIEVKRCEGAPQAFDAGTGADTGIAAPDSGVAVDSGVSGPVTVLECGNRDTTGATPVMGTIMGENTWSGTVLVRGDVYVYEGKLTIAPGTRILMDVDSNLYIGWNNQVVTLLADGTASQPITFCGARGDPGYWETVQIGKAVTSDSVLRNALFAEGGGEDYALLVDSELTVDNVQVKNSGSDGVWASEFKAGSRALSVLGSGRSAVVLTHPSAATNFPVGGMFASNQDNVVRLRFTSIQEDAVLHNPTIPYVQEQDLYTYQVQLTIDPGVEYRFTPDVTLFVAWNSNEGSIQANGTAAAPIRFRGTQETPGFWDGIDIGSAALSNSRLSYVEIRHGGGEMIPALKFQSPIVVDHVTLSDNAIGMEVGQRGLASGSTTLTITRTAGRPLKAHPSAVSSLPAGGTFSGNQIDQIEILSGTLQTDATYASLGVPYYFGSGILYVTGGTLKLNPGTEFVMGSGTSWEIGWNSSDVSLNAEGTDTARITFRGLDATPGYWTGLTIGAAVRANSVLNYLQIAQAGAIGRGAIELYSSLRIANSSFTDSSGYGIRRRPTNTTDYVTGNSFTNVAQGPVGDL